MHANTTDRKTVCLRSSTLRKTYGSVAAVCTTFMIFSGGATAQTTDCPNADHTLDYNCPLGPIYTFPSWVDTSGWMEPSQYTTIQAGGVLNPPNLTRQQLIARGASGIEVWDFDESTGQWQPIAIGTSEQGDAGTVILTNWTNFSNKEGYTTAQLYTPIFKAAHCIGDSDGECGRAFLAQSEQGIRTWQLAPDAAQSYQPSATWTEIGSAGPFVPSAGFDQPEYFTTIQGAQITGSNIIGRGAGGLELWGFANDNWVQANTPSQAPPFSDTDDGGVWTMPAYYSTIQTADLKGDGVPFEVLARGPGGMGVYEYTGDFFGSWSWQSLVDCSIEYNCPFADDDDVNSSPAYYSTIQTADIDGDGADEVMMRGSAGMWTFAWDDFQPRWLQYGFMQGNYFTDGERWNEPQYYSTIQFADVDGDGAAELVARGPEGIVTFKWNPTGGAFDDGAWLPFGLQNSPALADSAAPGCAKGAAWNPTSMEPDQACPWGNDPSYYESILTVDADGDGAAELVARGPFGIRTWKWDTATTAWIRYLPYGYPDFTGGEAPAYDLLNEYLECDDPNVRAECYPANDPTMSQLLTCLAEATSPPTASCFLKTPLDNSAVTPNDWTAVADEITTELNQVIDVKQYFADIQDAQTMLFETDNEELPSAADLGLPSISTSVSTSVNYFALFSGVVLEIGLISPPFAAAGLALGTAMSAAGSSDGSPLTAAVATIESDFAAIADASGQIATYEETLQSTIPNQQNLVLADQGLLTNLGTLTQEKVYQIFDDALLSAGRRRFTLWVLQTFTNPLFAVWGVVSCGNAAGGGYADCSVPAPAGVPGDGNYWYGFYSSDENTCIDKFGSNSGLTTNDCFIGVFQNTAPCSGGKGDNNWNCCWGAPGGSNCTNNPQGFPQTTQQVIFGANPTECNYNPADPNQTVGWVYGTDPVNCTLDQGDAPFDLTGGWEFANYASYDGKTQGCFVDSGPDNGGCFSYPPISASPLTVGRAKRLNSTRKFGKLVFKATMPAIEQPDLSGATLQIDRLLFEGVPTGKGELMSDAAGNSLPAFAMASNVTIFETTSGVEPRIRVKVNRKRRESPSGARLYSLRLKGKIKKMYSDAPRGCEDGEDSVHLSTQLTFWNDGDSEPIFAVQGRQQWDCTYQGNRDVYKVTAVKPVVE